MAFLKHYHIDRPYQDPENPDTSNPLDPLYAALSIANGIGKQSELTSSIVSAAPKANRKAQEIARWLEELAKKYGPKEMVNRIGAVVFHESPSWEVFGLPETLNDTIVGDTFDAADQTALTNFLVTRAWTYLTAFAADIQTEAP